MREIITKKNEKFLVSNCDFDILNKFNWRINKSGYLVTRIDRKIWLLHRYIFIEILKNNINSKNIVDHINSNKLDNTRENLRVVTYSQNSRNRNKSTNATSKYFGVSKFIENGKIKYRVTVMLNIFNKTKINAYYENEEHAAYQYDLWIKQYKITYTKINNIKKSENFILYKKQEKIENLPKGIILRNNRYIVRIGWDKNYGSYLTVEDAIKKLKEVKDVLELKRIKEIYNKPIKRNENNLCIIELFNKKKEKVGETIVDENIYYDLMKYNIFFSKGYANLTINKKNISLHRYIMNYNGKNYIDHINNNSLDNRKCNLRIVTPAQNSMNKIFRKNSTSKYVGVFKYKDKNKYIAYITINYIRINLGTFDDEIKAAKARDIATKKYFGEYGKLNFHEKN